MRHCRAYAAFLKERVAPADVAQDSGSAAARQATSLPIPPAPAPRFPSVPDLKELLALPQDEMTDIVQRFRGPTAAAAAARPP